KPGQTKRALLFTLGAAISTRIGGSRRPVWQQMQQQGRRFGRRKEPSGQARNWPKGRRKPAFFDVFSPTRFGLFCWIPLFWTGERERFENWLLRFTTNGPSPACQFLRMLWKKRGALIPSLSNTVANQASMCAAVGW